MLRPGRGAIVASEVEVRTRSYQRLVVFAALLMVLGAGMLIAGATATVAFGAIASGAALFTVLEARTR
jgi:hypothetical protein